MSTNTAPSSGDGDQLPPTTSAEFLVAAAVLLQPVAGLVIVVMQTGGELLEHYAEGRASAAVRELEAMQRSRPWRAMNLRWKAAPVWAVAVRASMMAR